MAKKDRIKRQIQNNDEAQMKVNITQIVFFKLSLLNMRFSLIEVWWKLSVSHTQVVKMEDILIPNEFKSFWMPELNLIL